MHSIVIKNIRSFFIIAFLTACSSLLSPVMVFAQSEADSVVYIEESVQDTAGEYQPEDVTVDDVEKKIYFRDKAGEDHFTINERHLPPGHVKKLKEDKDFWYADSDLKKKEARKTPEKKEQKEYVPFGQRVWVQALFWILIIGGFAGAIMWYLAESNVGLFRKKRIPAAAGTETDEMPEDIFAINYQREIDKARAKGDYRLAVRMMYLRLLKELSDKQIIQYKQDRTNLDYLMQVHSSRYYHSFFRLTRHFEYSWYGHFDVEEDAFKLIAKEFDQFDREIRQS